MRRTEKQQLIDSVNDLSALLGAMLFAAGGKKSVNYFDLDMYKRSRYAIKCTANNKTQKVKLQIILNPYFFGDN